MSYRAKEATPITAAVNEAGEDFYPLEDRHDFHDARLNLVAPIPDGKVLNDAGVGTFCAAAPLSATVTELLPPATRPNAAPTCSEAAR